MVLDSWVEAIQISQLPLRYITTRPVASLQLTLLLKRSPGLRVQNSSVQLLPGEFHVRFLLRCKNVDIDKAGFGEDFLDAIESEVWDDDRIVHFLHEFWRRLIGVVFLVVVCRGVLVVVVLVLVVVLMAVDVCMSVAVIMAMTVAVIVTVTVTMAMTMTMFVNSMISLSSKNRRAILVNFEITTLDKIRNHNHTARPESLLQLLRRKHDILEVVKGKADSRQVETLPFGTRELCWSRIGFVEQIAKYSMDRCLGDAGFTCARIVGGYHVRRDIHTHGFGDIGAKRL
jgi:hypothetical protein